MFTETLWFQLWLNEWVSEQASKRAEWAREPAHVGGGKQEMHARGTSWASHDKLWIRIYIYIFFFWVERCETVFIIIMKIIIMRRMVMIKKTYCKCYTSTPARPTLLNSCHLDPQPWWKNTSTLVCAGSELCPHPHHVPEQQALPAPPGSWCCRDSGCTLKPLEITSRRTACSSFLAWSLSDTLLLPSRT